MRGSRLYPNGMVFGANAKLNVGQTFVESTANAIDLVDGSGRTVTFGTNRSGDAQLLTIDPNALFNVSSLTLGGGNGQISNFGTLQTTNPNQYIGLIGGNINFDGGKIFALGGRVELGGLSAPGTITFAGDGNNLRAQFPTNVARGDVLLTDRAEANVIGNGGGDIAIDARNVNILGVGTKLQAGILEGSGSIGAKAGDIDINATQAVNVAVGGGVAGGIYNDNFPGSIGDGGNINIPTGSLSVKGDGARLDTVVLGIGKSGNIKIDTQNY